MIRVFRCAGRVVMTATICLAFTSGCEGGGQGMSVRLSAAERPDVDAAVATGSLRVPEEKPFNIVSFKSGQEGLSARGESLPAGNHGASCTAQVNGTGSAWSEFQLGYCFDNATGRPLQAVLKLSVTVSENAEKTLGSGDAAAASGQNSLTFLVRDTAGLVVRQETLASSDLSKGARDTSNRHEMVFDLLCEPDRGYYILLAGRAAADAKGDGSGANARLEVKDVALHLEHRPAQAVDRAAPQAVSPPVTAGS